ncbi:PDZ domain-containing protein [Corynebacterium sp. 3HC-13]|uniref:S1C family serine protease n=1 Tax=Corynebacterium poyangense TaxID=2684405 RepID=UPI001CCE441F|nr:trypsin-like peptidase domain-containing protein [Corynebacterium poyangense]MBZ8176292.1 PDZ domain-containing protein [Corynebacterium poyangense]
MKEQDQQQPDPRWGQNYFGVPAGDRPASFDQEFGTHSQSDNDRLAQPEQAANAAVETRQPPKKIGLGSALALMLVGSIVTGGVVGIGATQLTKSSNVVSTLEQPSVPSQNNADQAGSVEHVAAAVLPAVVSIQTANAEGSGSIISSDGLVLTNHHVAAPGERSGLQVTLNDGSTHPADFVASDAATDIAIIKIRDVSNLPVLEFGDSSSLVVGQQVVAVGAPLGLNSTVTSGIVSAMNRPVRASQDGGESSLIDGIQTDAAINPGNSGGPLVDMQGHLVGMNSVIASLSQNSSSQSGSIGLGFAIPSNFAKRVADQLVKTGKASQPMLAVSVSYQSPVQGALIAGVQKGGAGDRAGLKAGDVVTQLDDRRIDSADALIAAVRSHNFGETITLKVTDERGQNERTVEATLSND